MMSTDPSCFYFDLTDFLQYMNTHSHVTGIQRVISEVSVPAFRRGAHGIILDVNRDTWLEIDTELFVGRIEQHAASPHQHASDWKDLSDVLESTAREIDFASIGSTVTIVLLGANWGRDRLFLSIRNARHQSGARFACLVHDVVPLNYPEYCINQAQIEDFKRWFASVMIGADIVLTTARHNKYEIDRACSKMNLPSRDLQFFPLNGFASDADRRREGVRREAIRAAGSDFVLFVGTIEPRKDHLFVMSCWRTLIEDSDPDRTPKLVLAGSLGWGCEPVLQALSDPLLQKHVILLTDIHENELAYLYENCMFVIYNSIHEGWGLPVSESLAWNKVPLIPDHSSLLEAGGTSAVYFEARSSADFLLKATRLIHDKPHRQAASERVRSSRSLRDWKDISFDLINEIGSADPHRHRARSGIRPGNIYTLSNDITRHPVLDYAIAESCRLYGWHKMEHWGCWTSARNFALTVLIEDDRAGAPDAGKRTSQDDYFLYLALFKNHAPCSLSCRVDDNVEKQNIHLGLGHSILKISLPAEIGQRHMITFTQDGLVDLSKFELSGDLRMIGVGIASFMVCRQSDALARIAMFEHFQGYKQI